MRAMRMGTSVVVLWLAAFGAGCAMQYNKAIQTIVEPYQRGMYAEAAASAAEARVESEKDSPRNRLVLLLEEGATARTSSSLNQSTAALDQADKMFEVYDQKAKIQVGREAVATMTNLANVDYEGYGYDRIMANVYKALNYLQQGQLDDARIEIRRIADSQIKCEQRYQDRIAQEKHKKDLIAKEQASQPQQASFDYEQAKKDERFRQGEAQLLSDFQDVSDEAALDDLGHKTLYTNPYAEYLQAVFYLHSPAAGDREIGRVAMRNTAGMMSSNAYLARDVAHAEQSAASGATPPRTYVIFETGVAPTREQIRIDVPIFIYNIAIHDTKVDWVGLAFPRLVKVGNNYDYVMCATGSGEYPTQVLADMDRIVAREFKNELPVIIARTVVSAVIKAGIQYGVAKATEKEDPFIQIASRAAVAAYTAATNEADLRTWRTLPKQVQLASFPTPADGVVRIRYSSGAPLSNVTVTPGKSTLIWIRSPSIVAPAVVRQIPLN